MRKITRKFGPSFIRDRRGAVAVMVALGVTMLVGVTGLAIDVGSYYMLQIQLQNSADSVALSAVTLVATGQSADNDTAVRDRAKEYAFKNMAYADHGKTLVNGDIDLGNWDSVNHVFTDGGAPQNAVRVTTRKATQNGNAADTYFLSLFGMDSVNIVTEAIATKEANPGCLVTLNPTAPGALDLDSNSSIVANGCVVKVNSSSNNAIKAFSDSSITADEICVVGNKDPSGTGTTTPAPTSGCSKSFDPLAGLAPPPEPVSCKTGSAPYVFTTPPQLYVNEDPPSGGGFIVELYAGKYCGGIQIDSETEVHLNPGTYYIEGNASAMGDPDFWVQSDSILRGTGVTIYLTNGAEFYFDSNVTIDLTAPTTGAMAGMLIFQDRNDPYTPLTHQLDSDSVAKLEGVIYLPGSILKSDSNSQITGAAAYTMVIADKVELDSNATMTLNSNYDAVGGTPLPDLLSIAQLRR